MMTQENVYVTYLISYGCQCGKIKLILNINLYILRPAKHTNFFCSYANIFSASHKYILLSSNKLTCNKNIYLHTTRVPPTCGEKHESAPPQQGALPNRPLPINRDIDSRLVTPHIPYATNHTIYDPKSQTFSYKTYTKLRVPQLNEKWHATRMMQ